ncbi:hypothetical protein ACHAXR_004433 [Thalassiosira sp. AJA248-18]
MDNESTISPQIEEDTDELEDAYRMAIVVGSASEGEKWLVRETIERRLDLLVQKVADAQNHGTKCDSLNIDGAQSFLETLLRTLIRPPDPNTWLRLMNESHGKETPIMLRRGRTLLVSFLVGIKAPAWKEYGSALESSPVPSYLGYLSPNEELQSRVKGREQDIMNRSSYFLPAVDVGETTIPPSPIVTEVGLGLCVKNFLHKDTPEGNAQTCQSSSRSSGISLFRNYGPLQYQKSSSSSENDSVLGSIAARLPNGNELTRDLFDLTLRLAADDDSEHEKKPFPLRLVTPSAPESLDIVLRVVSDNLGWLSPHSITPRYRYILQHIIQTNQCYGDIPIQKNNSESAEKGFETWSRRVSYLLQVTKTANRGRMALYATQFMMLLCSAREINTPKVFSSTKQPHFYACLQLHQSSRFWNEIDKTANDFSSNVLDMNFCGRFLLPLSYQCALLLASSSFPSVQNESTFSQSQGSQSALSAVTILCSVLDVLADNGALRDCVHIGWAIQMLLFSVSHFVFGEDYNWRERALKTLSACDTSSSDSMWEYMAFQLNRLYCDVWGRGWQGLNSKEQHQARDATEKYIYYESIGNDFGERMVVLLPPFNLFISGLIKFACNLRLPAESNGVKTFCLFIANKVFDRYTKALLSSSPYYANNGCDNRGQSRQHEFSLLSSWIGILVSNLQEMVCCKKECNEKGKTRGAKGEEASTEKILSDLITPIIRCLHLHIMQRALRSSDPKCQNMTASSELVASVFVALYKQEVETFLSKPSPAKTRRWGVYRKCLGALFALTPPSVMFACPGCPALSANSAGVLKNVWTQYGQCDLSNSILIMVAAGLHVNASARATCLTPDDISPKRHDNSSLQLKQLYSDFSSQAKNCIINTFECFSVEKNKHAQENLTGFNNLIRFVRRDLSFHVEADIGLAWWNEISADLFSLLEKSKDRTLEQNKSKRTTRNIARAFSALQDNLSAISAISTSR